MIKLSKKIEYGILALQYIAVHSDKIVSAKEISEQMGIPYEFLSKTLQQLMKKGLIVSQHGIKGGYILGKNANDMTVKDIIIALEGKASFLDCFVSSNGLICDRSPNCTIKDPMEKLQSKVMQVFNTTTIAEIATI
ncbi:MAG: Rrf2 family transcriptional regulator [Ignavibacteriae bacterium]|nr:Rrf2 family transcriptional regulator [Ignavibacteriota bacterium]